MKNKTNNNYPLAVWITSIILGAIFLFFVSVFMFPVNDPGEELPKRLLALILLGTFFSSLLFVITYLVFSKMTARKSVNYKTVRLVLCITTVISVTGLCIFFGLDFSTFSVELAVPLCYTIAVIIAFYANPIKKKDYKEE